MGEELGPVDLTITIDIHKYKNQHLNLNSPQHPELEAVDRAQQLDHHCS